MSSFVNELQKYQPDSIHIMSETSPYFQEPESQQLRPYHFWIVVPNNVSVIDQQQLIPQLTQISGQGQVYKAVQLSTKKQMAVKVAKIDRLSDKKIQELKEQIVVLQNLNHPKIVKIYQVLWTKKYVYTFMELIQGKQLFDHLCQSGPIQQQTAIKIFHQILLAVQHMHKNRIVHRDIKPENIIISDNFVPKLIDFGLAKQFDQQNGDFMYGFCGSFSYMALQIMKRKGYYGRKVDVWSLGVTLYVILQAEFPFQQNNMRQHYLYRTPKKSSTQAQQVYNRIFQPHQSRITLPELLTLPIFQKYGLANEQITISDSRLADPKGSIGRSGRNVGNRLYDDEEIMGMVRTEDVCQYGRNKKLEGVQEMKLQERKCGQLRSLRITKKCSQFRKYQSIQTTKQLKKSTVHQQTPTPKTGHKQTKIKHSILSKQTQSSQKTKPPKHPPTSNPKSPKSPKSPKKISQPQPQAPPASPSHRSKWTKRTNIIRSAQKQQGRLTIVRCYDPVVMEKIGGVGGRWGRLRGLGVVGVR